MKKHILILLFSLFCAYSYAQLLYEPVEIMFKTEEKIVGKGKFAKKVYKFKNLTGGKARKIKYQEIFYIKTGSGENLKTYKCLSIKNQVGYFPFEELFDGKDFQLYFSTTNYMVQMAPQGGDFGGMPAMGSYSKINHFIKRRGQDELTILSGKLKEKVLPYVFDCPILIEKIESKEFKRDLVEIFKYYDENCD